MKKNIHINTTLSNQDMDSKTRCGEIVKYFFGMGTSSATDREIMQALGYKDMNAVRPRITELIKRGFLEECGSMRDPGTKRIVRLIRWAEKQLKLF